MRSSFAKVNAADSETATLGDSAAGGMTPDETNAEVLLRRLLLGSLGFAAASARRRSGPSSHPEVIHRPALSPKSPFRICALTLAARSHVEPHRGVRDAQGRQRRILEEKVGLVASGPRKFLSPITDWKRCFSSYKTGDEDSHGPGRADVSPLRLAAFETLPRKSGKLARMLVVGEDRRSRHHHPRTYS